MSYCRFAWDGSDVYVFDGIDGVTCCGCRLPKEDGSGNYKHYVTDTPEEMISHLAAHKRAGQFVPFHAIQELWEEILGPNEPANPEPPELTKIKGGMEALRKEKQNA